MKLMMIFAVLLVATAAYAAMDPSLAFCKHQGYEIQNNTCVFGNDTCELWAFYNGSCGSEHVRGFRCREEGQLVFTQFEECCDALEPYLPPGVAGQPSCVENPSRHLMQHAIRAFIGFIQRVLGHF